MNICSISRNCILRGGIDKGDSRIVLLCWFSVIEVIDKVVSKIPIRDFGLIFEEIVI